MHNFNSKLITLFLRVTYSFLVIRAACSKEVGQLVFHTFQFTLVLQALVCKFPVSPIFLLLLQIKGSFKSWYEFPSNQLAHIAKDKHGTDNNHCEAKRLLLIHMRVSVSTRKGITKNKLVYGR